MWTVVDLEEPTAAANAAEFSAVSTAAGFLSRRSRLPGECPLVSLVSLHVFGLAFLSKRRVFGSHTRPDSRRRAHRSSAGDKRLRRESKNLKDAVQGAISKSMADTNRDHAVHPVILWGAGLKHRVHPEIVRGGIDRLAMVKFLYYVRRTRPQALVRHDN
jgi:hypothetical protein